MPSNYIVLQACWDHATHILPPQEKKNKQKNQKSFRLGHQNMPHVVSCNQTDGIFVLSLSLIWMRGMKSINFFSGLWDLFSELSGIVWLDDIFEQLPLCLSHNPHNALCQKPQLF